VQRGSRLIEEVLRQWKPRRVPVEYVTAAMGILRAERIVSRKLGRLLGEHDLNLAQHEALSLLAFSSTGTLPLAALGQGLALHPATRTYTITSLEAKGLIKRWPDEIDGRAVHLEITPRGREVFDEAIRELENVTYGLSELSVREAEVLTRLLAKLLYESEAAMRASG
jgi:DNA-binding MarR family transcriptional regulator